LDHNFGLYENLSPSSSLMMARHAMKASVTHDPDTRRLHKAMHNEHQDKFLATMGKEIAELESHRTWTVVRKESMPAEQICSHQVGTSRSSTTPMGQCGRTKIIFVCTATNRLPVSTTLKAMHGSLHGP
jgi:hypothetical protein